MQVLYDSADDIPSHILDCFDTIESQISRHEKNVIKTQKEAIESKNKGLKK